MLKFDDMPASSKCKIFRQAATSSHRTHLTIKLRSRYSTSDQSWPKALAHRWSLIADIGQRSPFFDGRFRGVRSMRINGHEQSLTRNAWKICCDSLPGDTINHPYCIVGKLSNRVEGSLARVQNEKKRGVCPANLVR